MANKDADKIARFVKKSDVQMKECLMPIVKEQAEKSGEDKHEQKPKCHCGELISKHYYELHRVNKAAAGGGHSSLPVDTSSGVAQKIPTDSWKAENAIDKLPTNAAGKIKFLQEEGVRRISDFIRISEDTDMSVILELFNRHWNLFTPKPSLVISILGGAKNLKMDSKVSETFKSGLIMAAKSTNAWIITGGFNVGVMKLVGDAVAEWQGVQFDESGQPREAVRCIGICPWGYVRNRESLIAKDTSSTGNSKHLARSGLASTVPTGGLNAAADEKQNSHRLGGVFDYLPSSVSEHGSTLSLNPNHTHFIMVDNGKRNTFDPKVGDFRAKLEKLVSAKKIEHLTPTIAGAFGIPVVVVLVEGGDDSIKGCAQSIAAGIPVVACAGTGRAADILAYAYKNCNWNSEIKFNEFALGQLRDKIYRSYYEKFLTKFFDDPKVLDGPHHDTLSKVKKAYKEIKSDNLPRLLYMTNLPKPLEEFCKKKIEEILQDVKLCCVNKWLLTAFDCVSDKEEFDYAILAALANKKQKRTAEDLKEQLRLALTWNRSDIAEKDIFAHQNESFEPSDVADIIFDAILLDRVEFLNVLLTNGVVINDLVTVDTLRRLYKEVLADSNRNTPDANHLHRRLRLAARGLDSSIQRELSHGNIRLCAVHKLITTLLGCRYISIAKQQSPEQYDEYELDALDSRVEFSLPPEIAHLPLSNPCRELFLFAILLNRPKMAEFFWKRTDDCLCLALVAAKIFHNLASSCEGHQLDLKNSYMVSKNKFEELACSLCNESYKANPERALILVERRYDIIADTNCLEMGASAHTQSFLSTTCCQEALDSLWKQGIRPGAFVTFFALLFPFIIPLIDIEKPGEEDGRLSAIEKVKAFYRAPVTRFFLWHISYLLYLVLYTYVLLFDFSDTPSPVEIGIYVWTFTLFVDSIAEIGHMQGINARRQLFEWIAWSVWNPAMLLSYVFHLAGVICRFLANGDDMVNYRGKVLLACCLFILICRFSRVFSVHSWLGPKLVMIRKMMIELGRWLIILTIFNVAFGLMRAAIMFRSDQLANYKTFDNIVYFPFWNLWNMYDMTLDPSAEYYCGANDTTTAYGQACPQDFELLPIILAAYLIIAKIMLCNLLIAILNNVYGDVQQNSLQVWKYNFFLVAKWAEWKTWLPPPIGFIFHFTPYGIFSTCASDQETSLYLPSHIEQLRIFEREMLVSMTKTQMEAHRLTIEGQIRAVRESIGHVVDRVASLRNLDLIAKSDQDKSVVTKRIQQKTISVWKGILRTKQEGDDGSNSPKRSVETTSKSEAVVSRSGGGRSKPPNGSHHHSDSSASIDAGAVSNLSSRMRQLESGFSDLEKVLNSALNELTTTQQLK